MWSAWLETSEILFVALNFVEAGELETAHAIAHRTLSAADVRAQA